MFPKIIAVAVLLSVIASPIWASEPNLAGKWVGSAMGAKLKANVDQKGAKINGVAYVYPLFGKKTTYHFSGSVKGGRIVASHHQDHSFSGSVNRQGLLQGVVRTRKGQKISISAWRR